MTGPTREQIHDFAVHADTGEVEKLVLMAIGLRDAAGHFWQNFPDNADWIELGEMFMHWDTMMEEVFEE